jgi:hypothetical protein
MKTYLHYFDIDTKSFKSGLNPPPKSRQKIISSCCGIDLKNINLLAIIEFGARFEPSGEKG